MDKNVDFDQYEYYNEFMNFESTLKQFFKYPDEFNEILKEKINSSSSIHFNLLINDQNAFFYYNLPMFEKILSLVGKSNELKSIFNTLPAIAAKQYIRNSLVAEVKKTNEIEGVFSSRKEIFELAEDLKKKESNRISSIVNKYLLLLNGKSNKEIRTCGDIRKIYDDLFESNGESLIEAKNKPDGLYFRNNFVGVYDASNKLIHKGIVGEKNIISAMEEALGFLNNKDINIFVRIALFHYIFEYAHPFYDGNGRVGRYIISQQLYTETQDVFAFRVSAAINSMKNKYYKAFEDTEDKRNYGDISLFVYELLDIFDNEYDKSIVYASQKRNALEEIRKELIVNNKYKCESKHQMDVLWVLIQASVFSDFGVSLKEITKTLSISAKTIRRALDHFKSLGILTENKILRVIYYSINDIQY